MGETKIRQQASQRLNLCLPFIFFRKRLFAGTTAWWSILEVQFQETFRGGNTDLFYRTINISYKFGHGGKIHFPSLRRADNPQLLLAIKIDMGEHAKGFARCVEPHSEPDQFMQINFISGTFR